MIHAFSRTCLIELPCCNLPYIDTYLKVSKGFTIASCNVRQRSPGLGVDFKVSNLLAETVKMLSCEQLIPVILLEYCMTNA